MPHGFSLLEVLITLFLISLGFFGFAETELKAMQEVQLLKHYFILQQALTSLDEQLQSMPLTAADLAQWQQALHQQFPSVKLSIATSATNSYMIDFVWAEHGNHYQLEESLYA
jgi:prepilin-type N-terminal cleavage/methylation domain-containing protein